MKPMSAKFRIDSETFVSYHYVEAVVDIGIYVQRNRVQVSFLPCCFCVIMSAIHCTHFSHTPVNLA